MRRVVPMMVSSLALAAAAESPAAAQEPQPEPRTLTATGAGRVLLVPDEAELFLAVERARPTSRRARSAANRRVAAIRRTLRARGVRPADIRTAGVSVTRERVRRRRGRPARFRFRASAQLVVTAHDVDRLGALFDAAADVADDVYGPEFSFSDPSRGVMLATREALADARRRADDAAAQLGYRVTGVHSVDLDPLMGEFGSDDSESGAGGGAPTRLSPGRESFVALARVVYTIAPAT